MFAIPAPRYFAYLFLTAIMTCGLSAQAKAQTCTPQEAAGKTPATVCAGLPCSNIGATTMDGNNENIIACLYESDGVTKIWKAETSGFQPSSITDMGDHGCSHSASHGGGDGSWASAWTCKIPAGANALVFTAACEANGTNGGAVVYISGIGTGNVTGCMTGSQVTGESMTNQMSTYWPIPANATDIKLTVSLSDSKDTSSNNTGTGTVTFLELQ